MIISLLPKNPLVFPFSTFQWWQILFSFAWKCLSKDIFVAHYLPYWLLFSISSLKISLSRLTYCCSFGNELHFPPATFKVCFSAVLLCSNLSWFSLYLFCLEANNISTVYGPVSFISFENFLAIISSSVVCPILPPSIILDNFFTFQFTNSLLNCDYQSDLLIS